MTYRLGSLFDGSGGFPLAGSLCGIEPVWAAEIEPYPIAVTKSRFPNMKHLGSVTDINGAEVEPADIITFGSPCFPAGTLVLTSKGYRPIEELRRGDIVFTHRGNWKPISDIGYKQSRTIKLKGNHYGIIATPNHPFYSAEQGKRWNGNGYTRTLEKVGEWTDAAKMQGKRWAVPNAIHGIAIPHIEQTSEKQNQPPVIGLDLMYIIGRWLGDGWLSNGQRPNRPEGEMWGQIFICANADKASYLEKRLHDVFDGVSAISRISERTVEKFRVSNQALCEWIEEHFGSHADGKRIPAWAYCMSPKMREALIQGYIDSDGYQFKENTWKATTVSKKLAHGIRLLAETLGYSCTVHYANVDSTTVIEGRTVNQKPQYQVVMSKEKRTTALKHGAHTWYTCRTVEPYSDNQTVYNITVDDDHSYIVEGFVVHNCQDLSVAGKRSGLKHEANGDDETTRSGLFMEAVRIIKEMRSATNGRYPTFALWENVPGAFSSSKGEDFRCVLEKLAQVAGGGITIPRPPKGKWNTAGQIVGDGFSIAWRVLDAQYWGVPQRRRRIYLVADFRGQRAGEILFERESLRGYFAEGRTPWQGAAGYAADCAGADDCTRKCVGFPMGFRPENVRLYDETATTICNGTRPGFCNGIIVKDSLPFDTTQVTSPQNGNNPKWGDSCHPLAAQGHPPTVICKCYDARGNGDGENRVPSVCTKEAYSIENHPADSRVSIDESGKVQTLTSRIGTGGGNVPMVMQSKPVYCLQGNGIDRADTARFNGAGWKEDASCTLNTVDRPAVAYSIGNGQLNQMSMSEQCNTLDCMHDKQAVIVFDKEVYNSGANATGGHYMAEGGPAPSLRTGQPPGVCVRYIVRRLTPTECARLQGFPDNWGHPDHKDSFTQEELSFWKTVRDTYAAINGKSRKDYTEAQMLKWYNGLHTDSAEYKMWGNGIALPTALYVMQGIADELEV